jgi:hypothetical protein
MPSLPARAYCFFPENVTGRVTFSDWKSIKHSEGWILSRKLYYDPLPKSDEMINIMKIGMKKAPFLLITLETVL